MPVVFTVFELKNGWIQKIGPIYFEEVPSKGEFIRIGSVEAKEASWYEVLDMEFGTNATAVEIVLTLKRKHPQIEDTRVATGVSRAFRRLLQIYRAYRNACARRTAEPDN